MSENNTHKARQLAAQVRPLLPLLAAAIAVFAIWLSWNGWKQTQDGVRRDSVTIARDAVVQQLSSAIGGELKRLDERLGSDGVQSALQAGDFDAAARALSTDWPQIEHAQVVSPDLAEVYGTAGKTGHGRLAAMEAALADYKPTAWIVRDDGKPALALAAPALREGTPVAVAYVRLPLARVVQVLEGVDFDQSTYIALRHGSFTLIERGDAAQSEAAERMAVKVNGTDLRVAAAVPHVGKPPFGLSGVPLFAVSLLLLLVAYLVWRWLPTRLVAGPVADEGPAQTFEEALAAPPVEQEGSMQDAVITKAREADSRPAPVAIDKGIFRAYDIRGVVGQSLDIGVAEMIGLAVGSLMKEKDLSDIVVGRDGRLSGPDMVSGLVEGLRKAGRNVIDVGVVPTPVIYFGAFHLRTGCCISVTGSHNPPDYNGFKIVVGGETLSGATITDLYARIADDRLHVAPSPGSVVERDISDDYVRRIADDVQLARPLKVVVDAGNGVAGEIGPRVLEAIGAEVIQLFCEIDGTFPNHHPDPSEPHNLVDLIGTVQRFDADLGIAFDGDGDRLGVVTKDGQNIFPDRLLMLFAADVLDRNPGAVILYDVKCTGRLPGHILRNGGSPLMWKTGHSLIKAKMREVEAELAGEMSGHFFFAERWYGFDDGIYAAARLLEILATDPQAPSDVLNALPAGVSTAEIKINAPGGDPHGFVDRFQDRATFEGARLSTIDGLRVDWNDGWGLVRASNTTPVLVLRFDADSQEALTRIQDAFRAQLLAIDPELPIPF